MQKLIKFEASWCGSCKQMEAVLEQVLKDYPEQELWKVDIDSGSEFPVKYGIRGIPTLICVDDNDEETKRLVGFKNDQQVREWLNG